jgi:hypothetical protein
MLFKQVCLRESKRQTNKQAAQPGCCRRQFTELNIESFTIRYE